jgi:hypothetical protein
MREAITKVYPAERWQKKVAKMDDDQVMAIYFKFDALGKFENHKKPVRMLPRRRRVDYIAEYMGEWVVKEHYKVCPDGRPKRDSKNGDGYTAHQITFDELMRQT